MRHWLFWSLLLQCALVSADTLSERLTGFSMIDESRASFVENWSSDYLDEPLVSTGELIYKRYGHLSKVIISPEHIEQHVEGDQLSLTHKGETRILQLSEHPEFAASINALQAVLDGDESYLRKFFDLQYRESDFYWTLSLVPKDKKVADSIDVIVFQGESNRIQLVTIEFSNGDSLLTKVTHER